MSIKTEIEKINKDTEQIKEATKDIMTGIDKVESKGHYPAQCKCGHLFLERYQFKDLTDEGYIGFVWCGFCRTKLMVKPF